MQPILQIKIFIARCVNAFRGFFRNGHVSVIRTIWLNFRLLPLRQAIHLPIYIRGKVIFRTTSRGKLIIEAPIKPGIINIGGYGGPAPTSPYTEFDLTDGTLTLRQNTLICSGCKFLVFNGGRVDIGADCKILNHVCISAETVVVIEHDCRLTHGVQIFDTSFHFMISDNGTVRRNCSPVHIGHHSWLANRVTISKGVTLPPFTTVGQSTLVTKTPNIEEGCIIAGNPPHIIHKGIRRIYSFREECFLKNYFAKHPETLDYKYDIIPPQVYDYD